MKCLFHRQRFATLFEHSNEPTLYVVEQYSRVYKIQNQSEPSLVLGNRRAIHLSYSPISLNP